MTKLAQITKILSLSPIEGADKIETATVLSWEIVVRKGLYTVGDLVIFVAPDTIIPKRFLDESYTGDETVRLKTVRLRGQYSAGVILPIREFLKGDFEDDDDVTETLGVRKYEKPIAACLAGVCKGNFPTHIVPKTDEDNYKSYPRAIDELKTEGFADEHVVALIKADGSSGTFFVEPETQEFEACSRNLRLKESEGNAFWKIARKYNIEEIIRKSGANLAIQGEIVGGKIQNNPMGLSDIEIRVFLIKNLDTHTWFSWDETAQFCLENDLPHVDEVGRWKASDVPEKIRDIQELSNNLKYPTNGKPAEGIVLRTNKPMQSYALKKWWWSVKVLSEPYDFKSK